VAKSRSVDHPKPLRLIPELRRSSLIWPSMHRVKATDILALRKIVAERPSDDGRALQELLDDGTRRLFNEALPVVWCDGAELARLYRAAASVLFPGRKHALADLGEELALRSYSTVYKLVLAIPSFSFVVRRAGVLWSSYHDAGVATITDLTDQSLTLVVRGAPELPPPLASVVAGTIRALGQITRTKHVRVEEGGGPDAWRWDVRWSGTGS
jgi:hypothetical protein